MALKFGFSSGSSLDCSNCLDGKYVRSATLKVCNKCGDELLDINNDIIFEFSLENQARIAHAFDIGYDEVIVFHSKVFDEFIRVTRHRVVFSTRTVHDIETGTSYILRLISP